MRSNHVIATAVVLLSLFFHLTRLHSQTTSPQIGFVSMIPQTGSSSPAGVAIFGFRSSGVLITEAGVPASPLIESGRIFADVSGPVNTGLAIANPTANDVSITFYFTDSSGSDFGKGSFTLPAYHQIARFLTEPPFNGLSSMQGTFTFNSSGPISAVALRSLLNERGDYVMTTLQVSTLGEGLGGDSLVFPHFADGGGWTMQVVLVNPGDTPLTGSIQFWGQGNSTSDPQPVKVIIDGRNDSSFSYTIPARSAVRMTTEKDHDNIEIGSIRVAPAPDSGLPSGLAIFSFAKSKITTSAASVAALPAGTAFRTYVESDGTPGQPGSIQTGLAISNTSPSAVTVNLSLNNLDGSPTGLSGTVDVPAGGQTAQFLNEMIPALPAQFKGVLLLDSTLPIAVSSLRVRYNERGDLLVTTLPPWNDNALPSGDEVDFPHIVSGGGYSTQLVLLSPGSPKGESSINLRVLSQDGSDFKGVQLQPIPY
jgi:hypothetical protein